MESAKYHQLPEPDYLEIELKKAYGPPPTRLWRLRQWARRNVFFLAFLVLFLLAAALYLGAKTATRPQLTGLLHPDSQAHLKQAATLDDSQVPEGMWSAPPPGSSGSAHIMVDAPGSEAANVDSDHTVLGAPVTTNSTNVMVSPGDLLDDSNKRPTPTEKPAAPSPHQPTAQQDKGQAPIPEPTAAEEQEEPYVPIRATFFSSVEGPKTCRGRAVAAIDLPKPAGPGRPSPPQCYNFADQQAAGCAVLVANKADGCLASVYAETDCRVYTNTMAFLPELRPVGGRWRSVLLQCGVPEPDPATLGTPPLIDQMSSIVDHDKEAKGG